MRRKEYIESISHLRRYHKWTKSDDELCKKMYDGTVKSIVKISEIVGCTIPAARNHLVLLKIK